MAWTFEATERGYQNLWRTATLKGGADASQAETFANRIIAAEQRYRAVERATGVPWYFQGALHMRENGCNFAGVLHNGELIIGKMDRLTTLVPAGRGPFATWEESAIDALKLKNLHRVQDWSAARMLFEAENFNGRGYIAKGVNSPYVWAGTNHEQRGKYVADHQFDPNAEDTQLGVAAVLIKLAEKRPDIRADLYPATPEQPPMDDLDDVLAEIRGLRADIAMLVNAIKGVVTPPVTEVKPPVVDPKPADPKPPVVPLPATPTTTTPVLEKPGVGAGIAGLLLSALLQWNGGIDATQGGSWGQLLPIVSAGLTGLGATGMFGGLGGILSTVMGMFTQGKK